MNTCPNPDDNQLYLVPHPQARACLMVLAAELALQGRVYVLDGGNSFNPQPVARLIRRATLHTSIIMQRIQVARAFTCFQMAALIRQARQAHARYPAPTLVLDLLSTFEDENIRLEERKRVLEGCLADLKQIKRCHGVVVSARYTNPLLSELLVKAADHIYEQNDLSQKEPFDGTYTDFDHPGLR